MQHFRFEDPWLLILLIAIVPVLWHLWRVYSGKSKMLSRIRFPTLVDLKQASTRRANQKSVFVRSLIVVLRAGVVILFLIALMRPQTGSELTEVNTEVVDTILVLDTSGSMQALDFFIDKKRVTRLDAVKEVVKQFIKDRPADRIGMVVFGEDAFTQCPQTLDHGILIDLLSDVEIGMAGDGTAIGSAIAVASKRVQGLPGKNKVMILLTDGRSNAGVISPDQASAAASAFGIKIYTIGVGSQGKAPFLVDGFFGKQMVYQEVDLDEGTLQKIAFNTGGKYFRATNTESLQEIYSEIDKLEKTEIKTKQMVEYEEEYPPLVNLGILLLLGEIVLVNTRFQKIP